MNKLEAKKKHILNAGFGKDFFFYSLDAGKQREGQIGR